MFEVPLDSVFRSFRDLRVKNGVILVFEEIGVTAIDQDGRKKWTYTKDIIEDCIFTESSLEMRFCDEPPICLSIATGKTV